MTARFVVLGTGPLSVPKLPGIPGIGLFRGHSFHTSRWDYDYTGGNPRGAPMHELAGRSGGIPHWFREMATPGWQQRWLENFTANQSGGTAAEDLVQDGWTDIARCIRARIAALPPEDLNPATMLAAYEESDFEKMEDIRARADAVVRDPGTARKLKAWYRQLCKRPCFQDM